MDGEIAPAAVADLLATWRERESPAGYVVDVRPTEDFERYHIPGSVSIPFGRLPGSVERLAGAERVVTVCPHGVSSVGAARVVAGYEGLADGATVKSMAGGLAAWEGELVDADGEVVRASAAPGAIDATDEGTGGAPLD
ncbi:MAG: rhodanese-like domain-containing protein [Halobacteriaceae archaeon]